jgi:DNA-binding IclR family transcriptional regulator
MQWGLRGWQPSAQGPEINKGGAPDFVNAVAAPIRDASGRIVAALGVASPAQYLDTEQLRATMPIVAEIVRSVSAMLGYL